MPARAAALAVAALAPGVAQAHFQPPEGVPLRVTITESRDDGRRPLTFTLSRTLVFGRLGPGWTAAVTFVPQPPATTPEQAALAGVLAAFAGRTLVFELNGAGRILALRDEDRVWGDLMAGYAAAGGKDPEGRKRAAGVVAALTALPAERRRQMLFEPLSTLLAVEEADSAAAPAHPIERRESSPLGGEVTLKGTEAVTREAGSVRRTLTATAPLAPQPGASGAIEVTRLRITDAVTGLVREARETSRIGLVVGGARVTQTVVRTVRIDKVS